MASASDFAGIDSYVRKCIANAVQGMARDIFEIAEDSVDAFYGGYSPEVYSRTDALGRSPKIKGLSGTGFEFEYSPDYMNYTDGTWSGDDVLNVAMTSGAPHGGFAGAMDIPVWTGRFEPRFEAEKEAIARSNLVKAGLPVV